MNRLFVHTILPAIANALAGVFLSSIPATTSIPAKVGIQKPDLMRYPLLGSAARFVPRHARRVSDTRCAAV